MFGKRRTAPVAIVLVTVAIVGVAFGAGRAGSTTARAPLRLAETGLYAADGSIDPANLPFAPQYPLWTDGAAKSRWIHLPAGATIDVSNIDAWRFPEGTKIWKEFAWNGRKIETRLLWRKDGVWIFAAYVWNEEQTEALLAPDEGIGGIFEVAPGKRHSIPSLADCISCHDSAPAAVLGFTALQLSDDRDPLAPHAEPLAPGSVTLRSLLASGRLEPARWDLESSPPRIRETDPAARAAAGYLSANCGGCHNATGPLAHLGLDLLHRADDDPHASEPVRLTAVDATGRFLVPGHGPESSRRIAPGAPERSALLYRIRSRRPSSQMPPTGSVVADDEAIALVTRWIEQMR